MRLRWLLPCLVLACAGEDVDPDPTGPDAITLTIAEPTTGASVVRDDLSAVGDLIASVPVQLTIGGSPARVELVAGTRAPVPVDATGAAVLELDQAGAVTLTATAFDQAGAEAAVATTTLAVLEPEVTSCHEWLDLYGVTWALAGANPGVDDPINATPPIGGIDYRYVENTSPRTRLFGDCQLILSLARAAPVLRRRGVTEVADIGVYNYRCIGGGTPPTCPNGISQHAYAMAIDIAGLTHEAGYASVLTDWVIDPADDTCTGAATEPGADTFLHETICALKAAGVWNIVLTPNYNADHRNHFHVDLTPGADLIRGGGGRRPRIDVGPDRH